MSNVNRAKELANRAREEIHHVIHGQETPVELLLIALTTGGHALLEGVPGVGKTTLAKTFASVTGLDFKRVQLTPDLMPTDITGHSFYDQNEHTWHVRKGPAFTNLLLADEINRTPPRTQAALLEVMEEQQITIEGETMPVPNPFLLIATKNPIDIEGVYPLPEAQLDRFMLHIRMDYPTQAVERDLLLGKLGTRRTPSPVPDLVDALKAGFADVRVHPDIVSYLVDLVRATRTHPDIELGAGPRAAEHLLYASRAHALLEGRDFVVPDDVKRLAPYVLTHRILLEPDADLREVGKMDVILQLLEHTPVPVEIPEAA